LYGVSVKLLTPANMPPGMTITKKAAARFTRGVLAHIKAQFKLAPFGRVRLIAGHEWENDTEWVSYNIKAFERKNKVTWCVTEAVNGDVVAGGWFEYAPRYKALRGVRAAVAPKHRRRGIYTAVLKAVRAEFKRPLVSAKDLSAANAMLWSKLGVPDTAASGYRISPGPSGQGFHEYLLALLVTEDRP